MNRTFFEQLELAAQSFDLGDHHSAGLLLEHALESIIPKLDVARSPRPQSTDIWSELQKSIDALSVSEFRVSALCLTKALRHVKPANLDQTLAVQHGASLAHALREENFTRVADHLRRASKILDQQGRPAVDGSNMTASNSSANQ